MLTQICVGVGLDLVGFSEGSHFGGDVGEGGVSLARWMVPMPSEKFTGLHPSGRYLMSTT